MILTSTVQDYSLSDIVTHLDPHTWFVLLVVVVSQFNGTSKPKGSYSAKTGDNDCNINSSRYSLRTALCESIRYQAKSEQNVPQDLIPRVRHGEAAYSYWCLTVTYRLSSFTKYIPWQYGWPWIKVKFNVAVDLPSYYFLTEKIWRNSVPLRNTCLDNMADLDQRSNLMLWFTPTVMTSYKSLTWPFN